MHVLTLRLKQQYLSAPPYFKLALLVNCFEIPMAKELGLDRAPIEF